MFRDMASELGFFARRTIQFFSDLPSFPHSRTAQERKTPKSVWVPRDLPLTDKIRREQSKLGIAQIRQGHEPKPKKKTYRLLDKRIQRRVFDYGNIDLGDYLKGLAAILSL